MHTNLCILIYNLQCLKHYTTLLQYLHCYIVTIHYTILTLLQYNILHCSQYTVLHCSQYNILHCSQYTVLHCSQYNILHCSQYTILHCSQYNIVHCYNTLYYNPLGGIVHPGIGVHFDIAFINDHCGKSYMGRTSNFLEMSEASMASFLTCSFQWKCSKPLKFKFL